MTDADGTVERGDDADESMADVDHEGPTSGPDRSFERGNEKRPDQV